MDQLITMKSSSRLKTGLRILLTDGPLHFFARVCQFLRYVLYDQRRFEYFALSLTQPFPTMPTQPGIFVRIATPDDRGRIETELFPAVGKDIENDKRYSVFIGSHGVYCFIAEKDRVLVHYSWVFTDLTHAPITATPFKKNRLCPGDVFVGPVFTHPAARGLWIFPFVLGEILHFLRTQPSARRVLVFTDGRNSAAGRFYMRLGFQAL